MTASTGMSDLTDQIVDLTMSETVPMQMCPLAETCKGMIEKPGASYWMIVPAIVLIALGVTIIVYPQILAWLAAVALIVMGVAMLMMVNFMRGIGKKFQK